MKNMEYVKDKSAIITGGKGGIGIAVCLQFLKAHIKNLALIDLHPNYDVLNHFKTEYPDTNIVYIKIDVSKNNEVINCYKKLKNDFGQIHIVVNSAGIFCDTEIEKTLNINLGGTIYSSLAALSIMDINNGGEGGYVINISSMLGLTPMHASPVYNASKYGIVGFTRSLGQKYTEKKMGVKFMVICPGVTITSLLIESPRKCMPFLCESAKIHLSKYPTQGTDIVGHCVMDAISYDVNGAVWISNNGRNDLVELFEDYGLEVPEDCECV